MAIAIAGRDRGSTDTVGGDRNAHDFDVSRSMPTTRCGAARTRSRSAEQRFVELVAPSRPPGVDVDAALAGTEQADLSMSGYGVKAFTLSMIQARSR